MPETNVGAEALQVTVDLLQRFPQFESLTLSREGTLLEIVPTGPDTFPISLYDEGDGAMITAERWHSHYDDPLQVAFCVLWLLTPYYRVVHELKGGVLVAVWLERYEETGWEPFDPVYFLNPEHAKSWLPEPGETIARRYIQQAVFPPPQPYEEVSPGVELDDRGLPPDFHPGARIEVVDEAMGPTLF